jgi:large subunit ribosomal protein L18
MKKRMQKQIQRKRRVRSKIFGKAECPRLSVYRSNKNIYVQIIDDSVGKTLVSASEKDILTKEKGVKKKGKEDKYSKLEKAKMVGKIVAQKALKKKITKVVFDRGGYRYHGRVSALATGAREGGLKF